MVRYFALAWLAAIAVGTLVGATAGACLSLADWVRARHGIRRLEQHANQTSIRKEKP
ncbi:hypothetical protein [Streptomyces cyanogenus]|uniref:Uncharacterized protein n=1 Tax=Streptomyces cyanogenus TaxID=80860 RepID=A0ABX7TK27_STRCY|nr:hypothetical protein [Streptomyces cyanogenus]QTD97024.1 hypothetical protein S1361_06645 [Streptomyces cyanogenus]